LPEDSVLLFDKRVITLAGARGPGAVKKSPLPDGAYARAETVQKALTRRARDFMGVAFPHVDQE